LHVPANKGHIFAGDIMLRVGVFCLIVLSAGAAMISAESFWLDEGITASWVPMRSLGDVIQRLWRDRNSESQMPLYIAGVVAWGQLVPANEWALRSFNLIWLLGSFYGALVFARRNGIGFFPLVFVAQPFLWRYVNEFRPYAMQIFFAMWQLIALFDFYHNRNEKWRMTSFLCAGWLGCSLHMLGVIPVLVQGALILYMRLRRRLRFQRSDRLALIPGAIAFAALGYYYLQTLLRGAGGAKLWDPGLGNVLYSCYELTGLMGVGPSPLALRTAARVGMGSIVSVASPFAFGMTLYAVLLGLVLLCGGWQMMRSRVQVSAFLLSLVLCVFSLGGLFMLAWMANWPFWGRHLAFLLPSYVAVCSILFSAAWKHRTMRWAVALMFLGLTFSSLNLRFAARFAKEDYRQAVQIAGDMNDKDLVVWFLGSPATTAYYDIDFAVRHSRGLYLVCNAQDVRSMGRPDHVIITRPEVTDAHAVVRQFVRDNGYLQRPWDVAGFTLWSAPPRTSARPGQNQP
jgi:hypothetical protein